jgi:hypothetical protein
LRNRQDAGSRNGVVGSTGRILPKTPNERVISPGAAGIKRFMPQLSSLFELFDKVSDCLFIDS